MEMGNCSSSSERKKGPETATAIRSATVSFSSSSSSSAGTRPSCWRSVATTATARRRCCGADEHDTAARASVLHGDHHLGGIGKKKVDASASAGAGVRTLVERNDFYCQECNTHGK